MRRSILIYAALALLGAAPGEREDPRITLRAEYRQDALDYDDAEKRFLRESSRLDFGRSSAGITHIHIPETPSHRFTWHLHLRGISPHFDAAMGHYRLNFGTGLLVGKKRSVSPDAFTRRLVISRGAPFFPSDTGNPLFSFHGAAASATIVGPMCMASAGGFFSFRNRFAREDPLLPGTSRSGFPTILSGMDKDHRRTEPAEIFDWGCFLTMVIGRRLTAQSYLINTGIRRSGGRPLLWGRDGDGAARAFGGYGFFLQYRDEYIALFAELCFPRLAGRTTTGRKQTSRARGLSGGLAFNHPALTLSFSGKSTTGNYFSPYASGRSRAETAWAADITLRPVPRLSIGSGVYLEKSKTPSSREPHRPALRREAVSIRYGSAGRGSITARFTCVEKEKRRGIERSLNLRLSGKIYLRRSVLFRLQGTGQSRERGRHSTSLGGGVTLWLFNFLEVRATYARFFIDRNDPLYSVAPKREARISPGSYVRESSNRIGLGLRARWGSASLTGACLHLFTGSRTIRTRLEFSASLSL